ncbi:glutathione-disulfide reductase [Profundibacter amoris]|uniref:Glutathione reductase n=1 Tax=Profundibacter amoris TaxID=2171755 RepID=A0A347UE73_9RHOB|nr:glutathione-disulfide reductase [Profundibacter amoris]AXX97151.1 glutathione-disulfide reductase [Profundibacter amoris]
MKFDYDLFVIGGGSGGVRAGRLAASEAGAKVALAEEYRMGGTCVIRGCVPKKLMVFASAYSGANADARAYGWSDASIGTFDWPHFKAKLDAELDRLENIYRTNLAKSGVEIFNARAEMVDAHTVRLSSGESFTAKHILIAVGGRPFTPDFEGSDLTITSNDIFNLEKLPRSILIVGGGFIACEFACILNGLGVEVTQFYRGAQILRGFDDEARGHVADLVRERGVDLHVGTDVMKIEKDDQGLFVKCTTGHDHHFDAVMYATGRVPNTDNLGLENTGVELGRRGEIIVDDYSQTAVPSIYAVGDVTDRINLTPVAIREGAAFVDTVFHGKPTKADHELVASAVFTQPELGTVGMTEEEAREQEPIEVYSATFRAMQTGFAEREDRVMMKLIVSQATRVVLGCHIVADNAGEMIQLAAIAVKMGATKEDFDRTVAVHPTMTEELVTMKVPTRTA